MVQWLTMTRVSLSVFTVIVCVLTLQSSSASPIFSIGGDKPTPIRYTFRVERLEFGDSERDDEYDDNYDWEECSEEYSYVDDEEDEEETTDEDDEDYNGIDDSDDEEETADEDDEDYNGIDDSDDEEETADEDDEDYNGIDYSDDEEETANEDDEDYNGIDDSEDEEETADEDDDDYNGIDDSDDEEETADEDDDDYLGIDYSEEEYDTKESFPEVQYPYYPYPEDDPSSLHYDEYYEQDEEDNFPPKKQEIVSLPSVKKRHLHRQRMADGQTRKMHHIPTLMRAMRQRAVAARPQVSEADRPLSPRRHHFKRHDPQGH